MAFDNTVTVVGNVTRDPELRFTPNGAAVCSFGVAWNQKGRDGKEDKVSFFDITCWQKLAENVSETLTKGSRVVVYGRLEQRSWETKEGDRRSKVEIIADDVAPSLRWASAEITRNEFTGGDSNFGGSQGGGTPKPVSNEPPAYNPDEEPF